MLKVIVKHSSAGITRCTSIPALRLLTPQAVHYQQATQVLENRQVTLTKAFAQHPQRFKNLSPKVEQLPTAAWINQPNSNKPEDCKISH